ncbi:tRNA (adenosine(37)-N6)-threonylcarbamoyltransferase complex dimerization subunit type 1 TsaB [Comamonas faecalis]|uniref:tRNA (Adenosine(37)-N6)-threonylcarbamoyltransferase complex dimerization subunit type 1 TsaB n=1 Tax=Comamonas faecalis TaxID=1387849 RepID=A0ABP7QTZ8_9BURK
MKLLAFDTSTDTMHVAVQHGDRVLAHQGPGGAQASAHLIATVLDLLAQAGLALDALDALVFGRGPGSFTGLRTACSVAQGLAFGARGGAGLPVLPVDTLQAVAEQARLDHGCTQVVATLDARMGEVYSAALQWQDGRWQQQGDFALGAPETVQLPAGWALAGNARAAYGERLAPQAPAECIATALPTARALLSLAPALLQAGAAVAPDEALPLYVRDKVAQTTQEREAARRAAGKP